MKRRQLTKEELLRYAKESKRLDLVADRAPFTGMAVLCNYNLWKQDRWGQNRLQEYNRQVAAYELQLNTELASLSLLSNRLMRKAEFTVEYTPDSEVSFCTPDRMSGKSFYHTLALKRREQDNKVNELSMRYLLIHFNVMLDFGWGKVRLERNANQMNAILATLSEDTGGTLLDLRRELIDKVGVWIEMPDVEV